MKIFVFSHDLESLKLKKTTLYRLSKNTTVSNVQTMLNLPDYSIAVINNIPVHADRTLKNGEIIQFLPPMIGG